MTEVEEQLDPFAALLSDDDIEDPAEEGEERVDAKPAADPDVEPEGESFAATDDEPEAKSMDTLQSRLEDQERQNLGLRRKMFGLREEKRIRSERERLEQLKEDTSGGTEEVDADEIGYYEDGRFIVDKSKVDARVQEAIKRRQVVSQAPPTYDQLRAEVIGEFRDDERGVAESHVEELRESYQWLDEQVLEFCNEADIEPAEIGGLPNLLAMLDETGIRDDFESKYPDIPIAELVTAPTSANLMRASLRRHVKRRVSGGSKPAQAAVSGNVKPQQKSRPRSMARRGSSRRVDEGATLQSVDPESIFDMDDDTYKEYERRSVAALERRS